MSILFVACGMTVGLVLMIAGMSKWGRADATASALREFGVPDTFARRLAPALPAAELGIAMLLLAPRLAWAGAVLATMLLGLVSVLVGATLLTGKRPSCNCYGQVRAAPISWGTAWRNVLFTLCAGYLLSAGQGRLDRGLLLEIRDTMFESGAAAGAWLLAGAIVIMCVWLLLNLVRQQGRLLLKIDNLEQRLDANGIPTAEQLMPATTLNPGSAAPLFQGITLAGAALDLRALLQDGRDLLLVFISADCAPCKDLLSDLLFWRNTHQPADKLVLVSSGSREANLGKLGGLIGNDALLQTGHEINDLFGVIATPSALRIGRDGRIAAPLAVGQERIMALLVAGAPASVTDELRFVRAAGYR